jgi:hypothetical protein
MNKNILKGLSVAAVALFLVGCDELKFGGTFNILSAITFNQSNGNVVVNPGQFATNVTIGQSGNQKQIKLEIKNGNNPAKVQLNFDKNINVGDNFTLTAAQIGQNFDVNGKIVTTVTDTPEQSGTESCTYQMPQTICRSAEYKGDPTADQVAAIEKSIADFGGVSSEVTVPAVEAQVDRPMPGPGPGPGPMPPPHVPTCTTQYVTQFGYRNVSFHYETTNKDITASFVQGGKDLGDYQGHASSTQQIYSYQGMCR